MALWDEIASLSPENRAKFLRKRRLEDERLDESRYCYDQAVEQSDNAYEATQLELGSLIAQTLDKLSKE